MSVSHSLRFAALLSGIAWLVASAAQEGRMSAGRFVLLSVVIGALFLTAAEAWLNRSFRRRAHAMVYWPRTEVCMDLHCACGVEAHVHGAVSGCVQCGHCGRAYALAARIRLRPVDIGESEEDVVGTRAALSLLRTDKLRESR
jgi:hypothetical protein